MTALQAGKLLGAARAAIVRPTRTFGSQVRRMATHNKSKAETAGKIC